MYVDGNALIGEAKIYKCIRCQDNGNSKEQKYREALEAIIKKIEGYGDLDIDSYKIFGIAKEALEDES